MTLKTVILAAGQGTRMKSNMPKVLHEIAGKPMVQMVIESVANFKGEVVVIYGYNGEQVQEKIVSNDITWVKQAEQLGTGHAVQQTTDQIDDKDNVVILYADVPLIEESTIGKLIAQVSQHMKIGNRSKCTTVRCKPCTFPDALDLPAQPPSQDLRTSGVVVFF